jgi:DNA-binding LytR/AlgR family response regulator
MQYKIAVLDDEPHMLDVVTRAVEQGLQRRGCPCRVFGFTNVDELERTSRGESFDAFFLDISVGKDDGVALAIRLRAHGIVSPIVFVSGVEERVFEAFQAQPLRFVRKHFLQQDMSESLDAVAEQMQSTESSKLLLVVDDVEILVRTREILYVESANKVQRVVMVNRILTPRATFQYFEEKLPSNQFIKIHRCYLVNCLAIYSIEDNSLTLDGGQTLPVSRLRMEQVKKSFRRMYG